MREIVYIQGGQCGNNISTLYWHTIAEEHCISADGHYYGTQDYAIDHAGTLYKHTQGKGMGNTGIYQPRSVLFDLEPSIATGSHPLPNTVYGKSGAGNNWAKGYYTDGAEIIDELLDVVRREIEECDCIQGFQLAHSLGGGTGSGMGTLLISKLKEEYPTKVIQTFSVFPSPKLDVIIEPYNAILSIHQLIENADQVQSFDIESLYDICFRYFRLQTPTYKDLNYIISSAMSDITCSLRFRMPLNADLDSYGLNLTIFPRLHFNLIGFAPMIYTNKLVPSAVTSSTLISQMFSERNALCACSKQSTILAATSVFRGAFTNREVSDGLSKFRSLNSHMFAGWAPYGVRGAVCEVTQKLLKPSASVVSSSTAILCMFMRISEQFASLFKRRAFVHWYIGEGMDELEFEEAKSNVEDLISEYQEHQHV